MPGKEAGLQLKGTIKPQRALHLEQLYALTQVNVRT
jgi:hypothetical protein